VRSEGPSFRRAFGRNPVICTPGFPPRACGNDTRFSSVSAIRAGIVIPGRFNGKRYDCGSKLVYLQATVEYALKHPELNGQFREYLKGLWL
jgi:UTP--glucose-1-phosphate uridylyltransferase